MTELVYLCELCGGVLEIQTCQAVCPNCGRTLDCTDLCSLPANLKGERWEEAAPPRPPPQFTAAQTAGAGSAPPRG